jgi:hypothetical protein
VPLVVVCHGGTPAALHRPPHQGLRLSPTAVEAGHMTASNLLHLTLSSPCKPGAIHTWLFSSTESTRACSGWLTVGYRDLASRRRGQRR